MNVHMAEEKYKKTHKNIKIFIYPDRKLISINQ